MNATDDDWLRSGSGSKPALRWSFVTDAPLCDLRLARETGDIIAADQLGGLYLIDRLGQVRALTRTAHDLRKLAWADDGSLGAALLDHKAVGCFDRQLQFRWTRKLTEETLGIAMTPFGSHIAVSQMNSTTLIYDCENRKISKFETTSPVSYLQFVHTVPEIVVSAEHAYLARFEFKGALVWKERLFSNVGDLAVTGDGKYIFLAGNNLGVQVFDEDGTAVGSFVVEGTVTLVATTYIGKMILAATQEGHLACLDPDGNTRWVLNLPEPLVRICLSPLGDWLICGFASGRIVRLDQML